MAMVAPSEVMAVSPAPSVMVTASAAMAHMAVSTAMAALHLDHGIVLAHERARRGRAQHG